MTKGRVSHMAEEGLAYDRRQGVTHERRRGLAHDRLQGLTDLTGSRMTRPHSLGKQIQIKVVNRPEGKASEKAGRHSNFSPKKASCRSLGAAWFHRWQGLTEGKAGSHRRQGPTSERKHLICKGSIGKQNVFFRDSYVFLLFLPNNHVPSMFFLATLKNI